MLQKTQKVAVFDDKGSGIDTGVKAYRLSVLQLFVEEKMNMLFSIIY